MPGTWIIKHFGLYYIFVLYFLHSSHWYYTHLASFIGNSNNITLWLIKLLPTYYDPEDLYFQKNFNGEHIDDEFIIQILENANYAPSHKLTQPWLFKIFCKSQKNKLKDEILKLNPQFSDLKKSQDYVKLRKNQSCHMHLYDTK